MMMKKLLLLLSSVFVMNVAQAIPFDSISQVYFFGDSLTDSGYNDLWSFPPLPPGKQPTFTTYGGYIWSQHIAHDIKGYPLPVYPGPNPPDLITNNGEYPVPGYVSATLHGIDYAAAGSTTNAGGFGEPWAPSLKTQVTYFLGTHPTLDPKAVYFVWSGANDILAAITSSPMPSQLKLLQVVNQAAINIANEVEALMLHGAKRVVVLSLPNIGYTPLIADLAAETHMPTLPATMKTLTFTFNSMLNTQLGNVTKRYGIKVLYFDVYDLLDSVIASTKAGIPYVVGGQSFLFVNYLDPACGATPTAILCPAGTPTNYIFADTLHPTGMAHKLLSLAVETQLAAWK